jgi:ribosomal protein S18 acetylase RimI-like enzyme
VVCDIDRIVRGVPSELMREVAEVWYPAFGHKLIGILLPEDRGTAVELVARLIVPSEVYAALDVSGRVLGIAVVTGRAPALTYDQEALRAAYSALGAAVLLGLWRLLHMGRNRFPRPVRGLEAFAVREDCRGQGIGAAMIERIVADARAEGAEAIELNVGDNNPAWQLYERSGFVQTREMRVGPFAAKLGFDAFVYYERL